MKVSSLIKFSEENYFNGAVQTEWFYDSARVGQIANSYVFHGPKYFGVSSSDISRTQHKLIDTASFTKKIADKVYAPNGNVGNSFIMTIAGYGTGKSHLAVCLGALFSGDKKLSNSICDNIALADEEIGEYIRKINVRQNLVIVLNGMNNFNLDAEILKCARTALKQNGINDDLLHGLTKSYDVARHFVERNFDNYQKDFETSARSHGISISGNQLREHLLKHIEDDNTSIEVINDVYKEITGDVIHWDRGISSGDVLSLLERDLCGENKPFHKIIILFDEFGRYIEYAAASPTIAGEAALQQIFEAVQSANGNIIFTGFIQSDLSAYLSRIEKTANIVRYVGRYENSEKFYLSSNFETILANLLKKNEEAGFSRVIGNALDRYEKFHNRVFDAILRWDKTVQKKSVWTNFSLYKSIILKGCYPMHPITAWLLSNTSSWMQQRSTIAFASEMFDGVKTSDIDGAWLPYVYPIDIVDSSIYNEMLNSEEKGLVQSQFCMLYRDIILKVGNKLSENELKVLKSILILNVGKFSLRDKDDALLAIRYCSNVKEEEIAPALKNLEDMHGVIAFDENARTYDLIAEASGFNEFKRIYAKYRTGTRATIDDIDSDLLKEAALIGTVETSFAQEHNISSTEWVFEKRLLASETIDNSYFVSIKRSLDDHISGEEPRGYLIYAYCNEDRDYEIDRLTKAYAESNMELYPIIILFLDDSDGEITGALTIKKSISKFSKADLERFQKHVAAQVRAQNKKIIQKFSKLISQRQMISSKGIAVYDCRINALCTNRFSELFLSAPSFAFDGFQNKTTTQAKKYLANICIKLFDKTLMNIQSYQALTQDEKNRVKSCLSIGVGTSWQVFDNNCVLSDPQNELIHTICDDIHSALQEDEAKSVFTLMEKYTHAPYGMNVNAICLLTFYFIAHYGNTLYCYFGQEKLLASHLSDKVFKGSKIQINEFKRIRLQINANADVDQVAETCKQAILCTNISEFSAIKSKLETLIQQEGVSPANQSIVAQTSVRLDEGLKILKSIFEKNGKAQEIITEAKSTFVIHKFVKIFDCLTDFSKPLSDEYELNCSAELKNKVETIRNQVDQILQQKYTPALTKLKCDITQLSQVKALYKKIAEQLEQNGYSDFAEATKKRIVALEEELIAKQKYQTTLAEMDKELVMCSDFSGFTYGKLDETQIRMKKWLSFIRNASDLPNSVSGPLIDRLETIINEMDGRKNELTRRVSDIIEKTDKVSTLEQLVAAEFELRKISDLEFDTNTMQIILNSLDNIDKRKQRIQSIPSVLDELHSLAQSRANSEDAVYRSELTLAIQKYEKLEREWAKTTIMPVEYSLSKWTAAECVRWLDSTQSLPDYLTTALKEQYSKIRISVEDRLKTCRIDGVVTMFNNLSDPEKKQCLDILLREIK